MLKKIFLLSIFTAVSFGFVNGVGADEISELKEKVRIMQERIEQLESEKKNQASAIPKEKWKTNVRGNYYWDTREFNTFSLVTSTTGLPYGLSVWGFVDLHGDQHEVQDNFDQTRYFLEYRLSQSINPDLVGRLKGLGFQAEYNDSNGKANEVLRLGLTYKHTLPSFSHKKGWLQWRAFPYETDGKGQQMSLIYNFPLMKRVWISGFADLNLREGTDDRWVIEPQLNIKLNERFNFITEYRYSGFEAASATLDGEGVAFGLSMAF